MQKRNILTFLMLFFFSIAPFMALAQSVVTAANGTEFANHMNASASYTIRVTANFTMTNDYIEVPSGYTKTVIGWDASTATSTKRTIARGGTACGIEVLGTLNLQNIDFNGNNYVNPYSLITNYNALSLNNVSIYNCKTTSNVNTATTGCAVLSYLYYYTPRVTTAGTVTIRNCSGSAPLDIQGGTFTNSGTLSIYSNTYTLTSTFCGGMDLDGCSASNTGTINIYSNRTATLGGGMTLLGTTSFTNSGTLNVYSNTASGNGGGIWLRSSASFTNTATGRVNVYGNTSGGYGGGVFVGGTFTNNGVVSVGSSGSNQSQLGGGIFVNGTFTCGSNSTTTIEGNAATSNGGGVYLAGTAAFANAMIGNNTAVNGGGIFNEGTLRFNTVASSVSNNSATSVGGGLYLLSGTVAFNTTTSIGNNTSVDGAGGVFMAVNATFPGTVSVTNNNGGANGSGGGVYVYQGVTMTATGVTISGNTAGEGGGIANDGTLLCTGTNTITVTGNSATNGDGGGILNYASRTLTLSSTAAKTITGNTASGNGGGILTANGGTLTNCNVGASGAANSAANGGGIYLGDGTLNVTDGSCTYNTATANGAGIYILSGTANLNGSGTDGIAVQHNTTGSFGGGVFIATNAIMGINGKVIVSDNFTSRTSLVYDDYLKPDKQDDVCLQTLNDNNPSGSIGKIKVNGAIAGSLIGITEQPVASSYYRSLDAAGDKMRQFTIDYGDYYTSKAANDATDVFFSNDIELVVKLLEHPLPGTTTGKLEVTLGGILRRAWYVAGIVDDDELTWGSDTNSGLGPDVPCRTLTGPEGVFARGFDPEHDHIFVVRAISVTAEAAAGRLTNGKVVVRYPADGTTATFSGNTTAIADAEGSYEVVLHRYPGGHPLSTSYTIGGTTYTTDAATTNFGSGQPPQAGGNTRLPGPNTGPVFQMDDATHEAKLYDIHMDGLSEYSLETGMTADDIDELDPNQVFNPSYLTISPESALLAVEAGTQTITLNEYCDMLLNDNKDGGDNSATLREIRTGGGVYCAGTLVFNNGRVMKNKCLTNGGGVFVTGNGNVTMTGCTIGGGTRNAESNTAAYGGGFYLNGGTATLNEGCIVTYNTATANGGGAYINAGAVMQVDGNGTDGVLIKYNHAGQHGGGVYKLGTLKVQGLVDVTENTVDAK